MCRGAHCMVWRVLRRRRSVSLHGMVWRVLRRRRSVLAPSLWRGRKAELGLAPSLLRGRRRERPRAFQCFRVPFRRAFRVPFRGLSL